MVTSPAELILVVIASIATAVWLIAARYLINCPVIAARRPSVDEFDAMPIEPAEQPTATRITGAAEVEGERSEVSRKLAAILVRDGLVPGVPLQIIERTEDRVTFRTPASASQPRGEIRLAPIGGAKTRVDYVVHYVALAKFLRRAWIVQAVSLVILAVGFWFLRTFVATSTNPAVWGQSGQMAQIVHFLWPPFVLGYRYRQGYQQVLNKLDTTLSNLPHINV